MHICRAFNWAAVISWEKCGSSVRYYNRSSRDSLTRNISTGLLFTFCCFCVDCMILELYCFLFFVGSIHFCRKIAIARYYKTIIFVHSPRKMENIMCKITRTLEISHVTLESKRISAMTLGSLFLKKNLKTTASLLFHCTSKRRS